MMTPYQTTRLEPITVKPCRTCHTELLADDKFCRRCGLQQINPYSPTIDLVYLSECETKPLRHNTGNCLLDSRQLLRIVTEGMSARTVTQRPGRGLQRLVCALLALPIWMWIVLLSPFDAYTVSKAVTNGWAAGKGGNQGQNT